MSNKKSDYKKPHMDLVELIPEPLRSDVSLSIFNNIFNRYLTKPETEKVAGYIGLGNPNAIVSRQIQENDVHRQAFQLQPIPYNKIGTIEHMASWADIQNELRRLGVDIEDFSNWGATEKFNWVPPIDINKLINYRDYYWVGDSTDLPQYITIRSRCAISLARLNFWEGLIKQFGATFPVDDILEIDNPSELNTYRITDISTSPNVILLDGDATLDVKVNNFINVVGTAFNDGIHKITATPTYDGVTNTTTLISSSVLVTETPLAVALVTLRRFDKIVVLPNTEVPTGDYTGLFEEGFVFFYRNSTNTELNNSFLEVVDSVYDADNLQTTITITTRVTDNTAIGELSLEEELSIFEAAKACNCDEAGGWDSGLWDDNPADPLWGDDESPDGNPPSDGIPDFDNLITRISNPSAPISGAGTQGELWYDSSANILYQFDLTLDWVIVFNNFSLLLEQVNGLNLWDLSSSCAETSRITATDQWIDQNKWLHKNEITNFASVRRANQPIIEYDWDLELNEWTFTNYRWSYRKEVEATYTETTNTPPIIELEELIWWEHESTTGTTIILDDRYGDLTDYFSNNRQVFIVAGATKQLLFVDYSEYKVTPSAFPYRTFVTFTSRAPELGSPSVGGDLTSNIPNTFSIIPFTTISAGDLWQGYGIHWMFLGVDDSQPIFHQPSNPFIPISDTQTGQAVGSPAEYIFTTSLYAQNFLTQTADQTEFYLDNTIPNTTTRPLTRKGLFGFDDIRVYSADAALLDPSREFGTYNEIGEAVFDIVGIDFIQNEFVLGGGDQTLIGVDFNTYFSSGNVIRLADNNGIISQDFTIDSVNSLNKIKVIETIPVNTTVTGNLSNITTPITDIAYPNDFIFSNTRNVTVYLIGIKFFVKRLFNINVRIIIGPAAVDDIGSGIVKARTVEDEEQYDIIGDVSLTTTPHRIVEQLKTVANQYPLFDIYTVTGDTANRANPIFGYKIGADQVINTATGLRIVYDSVHDIYEFDQFLLDEDDGELFAYRDYSNRKFDIWYNEENQEVKFWDEITWSDKTDMSGHYRSAIVSNVEPDTRLQNIDGLYWYDTIKNQMFIRNVSLSSWIVVNNIDRTVTDINLQTIWKSGLDKDQYIPDKVDWRRRSQLEYNDERDIFVEARVNELLIEDPSLSEPAATIIALQEWHDIQKNSLSETGTWTGDWEIPDPLYFNHLHENRKFLNSRELLTHFTTIINAQPAIPGFSGSKDGLFNLIHLSDVNYAAGGTIKEFNNGFDTLISSILVNNVTPISLIEFAHDQYESLLNTIKEIYRKDAISLLSDTSPDNIIDISSFAATEVINKYELNDNTEFIYGDSTTFTDVDGVNDLGVKNWIATLPYLSLVRRFVPERIIDEPLGLNEVVHHDSHRSSYELSQASSDIISKLLVNLPDQRSPGNKLGEQSTDLPVNNITEFDTIFGSTNNRAGVYWYQLGTPNTLYRYKVVSAGTQEPSSTYPDETLWMDLTMGFEVLRSKNTDAFGVITWDIVDGLTIGDGRLHNGINPADLTTSTVSAWQELDLDIILGDIIFELENRLYENSPTPILLNYDFQKTTDDNPVKYEQYLEESFLDFTAQSEIVDPLKNSSFDSSDPFTWNYKRAISGGSTTIVAADGLTNSFTVFGNATAFFSSAVFFFVKNSNVNDGTWTPISSVYNGTTNTTKVFVTDDVLDDTRGTAYSGTLPSIKTILQPNNLNDGSESGGDWRDLYEKMYGTPYPHQEPWVLQGYTSIPDWWLDEYLNDDEDNWGVRRWKYKHGFEITAVNETDDTFGITGQFIEALVSESSITIDNSTIHAGVYAIGKLNTVQGVNPGIAGTATFVVDITAFPSITYSIGMKVGIAVNVTPLPFPSSDLKQIYTIKTLNLVGVNLTIVVEEEILAGDIIAGTDYINGAIFNPNNNTTTIYAPASSVTNGTVEGRIAKRFGMWESIRTGVIPAGRPYPNNVISVSGNPAQDGIPPADFLPTFNYFSVNIDNIQVSTDGFVTTFNPDDVLPPFWNYTIVYTSAPSVLTDITVRSLYSNFSTEIISPNANYVFGDAGSLEWEWRTSSQFLYDQLAVAYRIDPANFLYQTFGFNFTTIGGLLIDRDVRNTASHTRTNFHGDVVDNQQFISNGLNQWFVNFNRFEGYDANFSDFQSLWTLWKAPMTYQFASFVDTPSLDIGHRFLDLVDFDFNVTSKRAPGVDDFWLDALKVQILDIAFDIAQYNNQIDWRFELSTNISRSRKIEYYDIHNYQFYADPVSNECTLYTWTILNIDTFNSTFTINGNHEDLFIDAAQFEITGSTGNNGVYDVFASSYDIVTKLTTIEVNNIIVSTINDGLLTLGYRTLPWETGMGIYLSSTQLLPQPLLGDTVIGTTKYFLIKTSDTTFKLARTEVDSNFGAEIDITNIGTGDHYIGELFNTFKITTSKDINWRQYAIDKTNLLSFNTPSQIQGMQPFVDVVRGYAEKSIDDGWVINEDKSLRDPDSGKIVSWNVEIERFIDYAYSTRIRRSTINDRYKVTADTSSDVWTFGSFNNTFITGDRVNVLSSNTIYPIPISRNIAYFIIRDTLETFRLAATRLDANDGIAIGLSTTTAVGDLSILSPSDGKYLVPPFELNAFRNAAWFRPPSGIVSNVVTGPVEDIRTTQLIFDQNGNSINIDQLRVYRQDKETKFVIENAIPTESDLTFISQTYSLIRLGGMHIFTDAYEHVLLFNNYTSADNLLYDPFIGLNVSKYEMLFNRNPEFTQRPNVGGYYLETFFNQGANIKENFESGVEGLRLAYDTYDSLESNSLTKHSRDALGYAGEVDYLDNLNLTRKSQFLFWRGQIQNKGSINAVKAYINSRRFIDAKIDEFWAIKIADFGSMAEKEYPEMFVTTVDARSNEFKAEFIASEDLGNNVDANFTPIRISDIERWYIQPNQLEVLRNNNKIMYFDMKAVDAKTGTDFGLYISNNGNTYIIHGMDVDLVEITHTDPVTKTTTEFVEGVDFININQFVVQLLTIGSPPTPNNITVWGFVVNYDAQNPARIIDRDSETQLSTIEFWDPARGNHYSNAIHNVDLQNTNDPAIYTNTSRTITGSDLGTADTRLWGVEEIATSWMDLSTMYYVPYQSDKVITDNTVRFREWGQLHDFSGVNLYEWVESNVPPEEWDALAETEAGDNTIPEDERKSGTAKFTLFEKPGSDWVVLKDKVDIQYAATHGLGTGATRLFIINTSILDITRDVDIYINEVKQNTYGFGSPITNSVILTVSEADVIKFVQPIPTDVDVIAAGVVAGTWLQEYEYTTIINYDTFNASFNKYYFWVANKSTKPLGKNRIMSLAEAQQQLVAIPAAHMFFQKALKSADAITGSPVDVSILDFPNRFTQIIIRGLQGIIFDDSRYTIRFTRDFTLRDNLEIENVGLENLELKNLHEEWKIFRQEQTSNIDKFQWDKITESIVGYLLADPLVQVPSFERKLYDEKKGTDTQYGLGNGQAFVDGTLALSSILGYLTDPDVDFSPININSFFGIQRFDTPENIIAAMDIIYNTFKFTDVNRMYFSVLHDAFTTKAKYPGLFKTSMVSLHGIKPFQSGGVFDD